MLIVASAVLVLGSRAVIVKGFKNAEQYVYLVWGMVGIIFAVAIAIELRKKPPIKLVNVSSTEFKPLKSTHSKNYSLEPPEKDVSISQA